MRKIYSPEEITAIYENLPEKLKKAIFSTETSDVIFKICEENGLEQEKIPKVAEHVGDVLLGIVPVRDFRINLDLELNTEPEKFNSVYQTISRKIFEPLKKAIEDPEGAKTEEKASEKAEKEKKSLEEEEMRRAEQEVGAEEEEMGQRSIEKIFSEEDEANIGMAQEIRPDQPTKGAISTSPTSRPEIGFPQKNNLAEMGERRNELAAEEMEVLPSVAAQKTTDDSGAVPGQKDQRKTIKISKGDDSYRESIDKL